ncbi:MAG TPA: glycoside hydrolase family 6 protein [Jatrophihabitans sp.]
MLLLALAWPGSPALAQTPGSVSGGPFKGKPLHITETRAEQVARTDSALSGTDRARIAWLGRIPQATWLTGGTPASAARLVATEQAGARATGTVSQLVIYDLPHRDCGSASAGGVRAAASYKSYVQAIAASLGRAPAIVVLEPDSLANAGCLSKADYAQRMALERYAVARLGARPGVAVYLDGGNHGWQSPRTMAQRLVRAGIVDARGFALNVSNFDSTQSETDYGLQISRLVGWKRFVIDTSRNGAGTQDAWCNPPDAAVGSLPGAATLSPAVDALLWVKHPGESDGRCGASQAGAGAFDPTLALSMMSKAGR